MHPAMREKYVLFILVFLLFLPTTDILSTALPTQNSSIQPAQVTQLALNSTIQGSVTGTGTNLYNFTLTNYTNITLTVATTDNLSLFLPYQIADNQFIFYTNYANLTKAAYLVTGTYWLYIGGNGGDTTEHYSLSITSTPVKDYHNHERATSYYIKENQIVSQVSNYTNAPIDNWFNLSINNSATYRFNLAYNSLYNPLGFRLYNIDHFAQIGSSYDFPVGGSNQTLLSNLSPGNYSLVVRSNGNNVNVTTPFKLWYTRNFQVQGPSQISLDGLVYGTLNNTSPYQVTLNVDREAVFYFLSTNTPFRIEISGNGISSMKVSDANMLSSNQMYVQPGHYTLNVTTTEANYIDCLIQLSTIPPDILETDGNSRNNPYYLTRDSYSPFFTIHIPSDTDWFAITVSEKGEVYLNLVGSHPDIQVFEGDTQIEITGSGTEYQFLGQADTTYLIKAYTTQLGIPEYSIQWRLSTTETSASQGATSRLKIGYPYGEIIFLIALPLIVGSKLRKFHYS